MARTLADLFDLQHDPALHDDMTFASPATGDPVGLSFIIPNSQEDLLRRRRALEIVADAHHGILGRTPDYVNIQVTATRQMAEEHGRNEKMFAQNLVDYHAYIRDNDLSLTHCFGHPQVNRGAAVGQQPDPYIPVGVVDTTCRGRHPARRQAACHPRALLRRALRPALPPPARRGGGDVRPRLRHPRGHEGPQLHLPRELRHGPLPLRPTPLQPLRRDGRPRRSSTTSSCRGSASSATATGSSTTTSSTSASCGGSTCSTSR